MKKEKKKMTLTIKKPSSNAEGFHGILYGEPGTGKTSTADDPELKTLLLDLEGGSSVLSEATNTDIIEINTWEDLVEAGKSIKQGFFETSSGKVPCTYDMIFIDSITRLQDLCKEYVVRTVAPNRRREIQTKFGAMADWGDLKDLVVGLAKSFHSLTKRGEDSIHVVWIAHKDVNKDDVTGNVTSTKIQVQGGNTAEILMSIVDGVFYMFKKTDDQDKTKTLYGLLTDTHGVFSAKIRQSKKREKLPHVIYNPVWSEILEKLGYKN